MLKYEATYNDDDNNNDIGNKDKTDNNEDDGNVKPFLLNTKLF